MMRVYFLSELPCRCFVSGLYLGAVDGHERTIELSPQDGHLVELIAPGYRPIRFLFDEAFLLTPPACARLYFSEGEVAVYLSGFLSEDTLLRPIWQERRGGVLLTLYMQGGVQLSIESAKGFFLTPLPAAFADAKLTYAGETFLLETSDSFAILSEEGTVLTLADGTVSERGPSVLAEVPLHDCLGHTAVCRYEGGKLAACTLRAGREASAYTKIVALFESVLIGADATPFLGDALKEKAGALREYLGNFTDVALTARTDTVGLVYPVRERVFEVRPYRVTLNESGEVVNIAPVQ